MEAIDKRLELKLDLMRRGLTLGRLARLLKVPPTTLSSWLTERHPAPQDLFSRIERALSAADRAPGKQP